jgi:heavy metal efflux system protein
MGRLVAWSLRRRLLVVLAVVGLIIWGGRGYAALSVDAVPDITNVQVQVLTNAPGLSPLEVEAMVTRPVELALMGLPGTQTIRSISRSAVSAVTVVFHDDVPLESARTLVSQRLAQATDAIPASAQRPEVGPLTTGLGEIFHFTLSWPGHPPQQVRALLDWEVAMALRSVPGVVEVNAWGGPTRQIEVRVRPEDAQALGVPLRDVARALLEGGQAAGGGALERGDEQVMVRLDGRYRTAAQIGLQVVGTRPGGQPVLVRDVATVIDGTAPRLSAATADGEGETVYAMVQMVAGGNAHDVVSRVKARLAEVERQLPEGARVRPFYDRSALVDRVLGTVRHSLVEGGVVVVVVLLLLLGDAGAALAVASAIPLAMLGAFGLMHALGMSGNLMSLGAIDFGLVVDGPVVIVEGAMAAMAAHKLGAREALGREGAAVGTPIAFGIAIIAAVYVPVLLLEGVEGKMFRPMALTVLFALGTTLVLTFTWIPVAAATLLRRAHAREPLIVRAARRAYTPLLSRLLARPALAAGLALGMIAVGAVAAWSRGAEFVPRLEEGDLVVQVTRPPSVSVTEAIAGTTAVERALGRFPEVTRVVSRSGSPDVATDVMGIEQSDVYVLLRPRAEWTTAPDREGLVAAMEASLQAALPGAAFSFTQPIEMRAQELLGGMRSDVGVKVFGDDLAELARLSGEVARALSATRGAADVRVEPLSGLPLLTVRPDPARMGRLGVGAEDLQLAVETLRGGVHVGSLVEGERRFDVALRLAAPPRPNPDDVARTPLLLGTRVLPLGDTCEIEQHEAPAQISREQVRRRVMIEANVRGRDLGSFVSELQGRLRALPLPPGYRVELAGQYENLVHATERLALVVPLTLGLIFVALYMTFGEARPALLIFLNVPAAASGGAIALWARGLPLSISAGVGFVALFGVATLNGVVLITSVRRVESEGKGALQAAQEAAHERLRPVLTTAVVAALGFVPMAVAVGTGAEVQRPLATVVIGGLVTATALTLGVLPSLYARLSRKRAS